MWISSPRRTPLRVGGFSGRLWLHWSTARGRASRVPCQPGWQACCPTTAASPPFAVHPHPGRIPPPLRWLLQAPTLARESCSCWRTRPYRTTSESACESALLLCTAAGHRLRRGATCPAFAAWAWAGHQAGLGRASPSRNNSSSNCSFLFKLLFPSLFCALVSSIQVRGGAPQLCSGPAEHAVRRPGAWQPLSAGAASHAPRHTRRPPPPRRVHAGGGWVRERSMLVIQAGFVICI